MLCDKENSARVLGDSPPARSQRPRPCRARAWECARPRAPCLHSRTQAPARTTPRPPWELGGAARTRQGRPFCLNIMPHPD